MKNSFNVVAAIITLAFSWGAVAATGCGASATSSLCEDICACQRCTTNDFNACIEAGDQTADQADQAGCSNQFDAVVACSRAHVSCRSDRAVFEECEAERAALTSCSSTIIGFGRNACEQAADRVTVKFTSCGAKIGGSSSSGTTVECTPQAGTASLCQAACVDAADCSLITPDPNNQPTDEQSKAFSDCISSCQ